MPDKLEWILFDADHTLFDFERTAKAALNASLSRRNIALTEETYPQYVKINRACWDSYERGEIGRHELVRRRFSEFFDLIDVRNVDPVEFNSEFLSELPRHPFLFDGAEKLLIEASGKYRLGLITNGLKEVQRPRLRETGTDKYFEVIVVSGEIGHVKPETVYFDYVHREMGSPRKQDVMVIGDALYADIYGGAQFGYRTCWYNPEGRPMNVDVEPDFQVATYRELYRILGLAELG